MKTKIYSILVMLFIATLAFVSCGEDDPIDTVGGITGTVTEEGSNTPISAAEVVLSGVSQTYKTGDDGKFEIKNLEEKDYTITVTKSGYNTNKKQATVKAGTTTNLDFSLEKQIAKLNVNPGQLDFDTNKEKMTFVIVNDNPKTELKFEIEKEASATWLSLSTQSGSVGKTEKVITVTVDRSKMAKEQTYTTTIFVKSTNGQGVSAINISAVKQGAGLNVSPSSLNFGNAESEKTVLVSNSTKVGTLTYKATANESWITIENGEGTITESKTGSVKISVSRLNLAAGNHNGTVVIESNKNTVTVNVSMEVVAKQKPSVSSMQNSEVKHNSIGVSAHISSVGSAAVSAYGFCWGTSPNPTTADNKNNLGGTSTNKSFDSTITGLNAQTLYYIRAFATNEEGTSYSDAISITTATPPTMAVVRTFDAEDVKYNQATGNGSIDDLGDGYVTAYGFCYSSTNPNPTLNDGSMSLGSITTKGNFSGKIEGLEEQKKYFIRAYATNSKGTAYGASVELTTPVAPPLVTGGLIAYYTFNNEKCDEYFGKVDYRGVIQGTGQLPTYSNDVIGNSGKSLQTNSQKYFFLPQCPDFTNKAITYSVWVKTTGNGGIYEQSGSSNSYQNRKLYLKDNKVFFGYSHKFELDVSSLLLDGQWHLLTITTTDSRYFKLYIDALYYETKLNGVNWNYGNNSAVIGRNFIGKMDNLRIYNRALTQEEINDIYNAKQ